MAIFRADPQNVNPSADLLSVEQVAKLFKVTPRTVWRWERKSLIPRGKRITRQTVRWQAKELIGVVVEDNGVKVS